MAINGVNAGGSGTFQIGLIPPNGVALQSGPTVESPDSLVTLSAVDANLQFTASVDASETLPTFVIGVDGVNGAGEAIHADFVIPVLPGAPVQVTDFSLDQIATPPAGAAAPKHKK